VKTVSGVRRLLTFQAPGEGWRRAVTVILKVVMMTGSTAASGAFAHADEAQARPHCPINVTPNRMASHKPVAATARRGAIDLKTGKMLWDKPLGSAVKNRPWGIPSMLPLDIAPRTMAGRW
jgi:hypothetical protein